MKIKNTFLLILLFIISILIWGYKYYLLFFSTTDKNIREDIVEIFDDTSEWKLKDITYKQLLSLKNKQLLTWIRIWLVNYEGWYLKIWIEKYYFIDYEENYPWNTKWLNYWDTVYLEYIQYNNINYITYIWKEWVSRWTIKEFTFLPVNWKILDINTIEYNLKDIKLIYWYNTDFYEKEQLDRISQNIEFLNKFNSWKTSYKVVRVEWILKDNEFFVTKAYYWILYNDEKKKIEELTNKINSLKEELEQRKEELLNLFKKKEYDRIYKIFKKYPIEYNSNLNFYQNISQLTSYFNEEIKKVIVEYEEIYKKK